MWKVGSDKSTSHPYNDKQRYYHLNHYVVFPGKI